MPYSACGPGGKGGGIADFARKPACAVASQHEPVHMQNARAEHATTFCHPWP